MYQNVDQGFRDAGRAICVHKGVDPDECEPGSQAPRWQREMHELCLLLAKVSEYHEAGMLDPLIEAGVLEVVPAGAER